MPILPYNALRFNRGNAQCLSWKDVRLRPGGPALSGRMKRWLFSRHLEKSQHSPLKYVYWTCKHTACWLFCQSLPVLGGVDLVIPSDVSVANNGRLSVGEDCLRPLTV